MTRATVRRTPDRFRREPADFRPDERFDALLRAPDFRREDFFDAALRVPDFRREDFLDADFRPPDFRPDAERFRAPDFRELLERLPLRELPRDDFFLDAMNSLLVRW